MFDPKDMDVKSLANASIVYKGNNATIDLFTPSLAFDGSYELLKYIVPPAVEGRIDLLMEEIYGVDSYVFSDLDVILHINNIDNPLSIITGMTILYPGQENLESFRWTPNQDQIDGFSTDKLTKKLMFPNKTTSSDPNRRKHLRSSVAVPPTVNLTSKPPVVVGDGKIIIGGI
jgi:hypothetical protein